ncbi:MAG: peptide MFS transporter [Aureliella sp.]
MASDASPKAGSHPAGLYVLFFTEMWERFGFYLMLGIFFLYMTGSLEKGGLGLSDDAANDIYGTYLALVYLTPFLGGLLADRIFGYGKTIVAGGALMAAGYLCLAVPGLTAFGIALTMIIIGNGLFKPNISTLLGNLYNREEYIHLKDRGYNIFYMGINIGAFICNFVAAYLRNNVGWGAAFASAGVGMLIGLAVFLSFRSRVAAGDQLKPAQPEDMSLGRIAAIIFLPALIFATLGFFAGQVLAMIQGSEGPITLFGSRSNDAFLFACIPVVLFYLSTFARASAEDRKPIGSLLYIFAVVIIFWAVFHQNGNVLTRWAEDYTHREMPAAIQPAANSVGLEQVVTTSPGPDGNVNSYFENLPKEQWPAPGEKLSLISTELFQSLNPFFVVIFTPVVVSVFSFLASRGREPSTPAKIALGLSITALSTLIMIAAVYSSDNGQYKVSAWWLVSTYAVITVGELCLSPMGLSLVSKLSPPRLTALMMGGWFLSTSIGNKLAGVLGHVGADSEDKSTVFWINFAGLSVSALLLLVMVPRIRAVMKAKTGHY